MDWIVTSRLEVDWYKFTMSLFIWKHHRRLWVRFALNNRHRRRVWLPNFVSARELREELDHVRTLRFTQAEIAFLRESPFIPKGFFPEEYLHDLCAARLPEVEIRWDGENDSVEVEGEWWIVTFWETIIMNVVNVLYFRELARREGRSHASIREEGMRRLLPKLELLATRRNLRFSPFGLRRTVDLDWNREMEATVCARLPSQVAGISNVRSAMRNGKPPSGTCAHEMIMVTSALAGTVSDAALRHAPMDLTRAWFQDFGPQWSVAIPDTFGSASFLSDTDAEVSRGVVKWKIDSGDPIEIGERHIRFFQDRNIDPLRKILIFCDGQDERLMVGLQDHFEGRVGLSHGPGTNFSNDVGFTPISIVVKAVAVLVHDLWVPTVKLSDNLGKAQGPQAEVERYVRVFDYHNTYAAECRV